MNVRSAHRISGLVVAASLAGCLIILILASGAGAAAAKYPDRVSARVKAELATVTGGCDDGCSDGWAISDAPTKPLTISGTKYEDLDADGDIDEETTTLDNWTIEVYTETFVTSTTTGGNGDYEVTLDPGTYTVCEVLKDGWTQSYPGDDGCHHDIILDEADVENLNFGNWTAATLSGTKYEDLDADGDIDEETRTLENWTIEVFEVDGVTLVDSTTTGVNGHYEFTLDPGDYTVCEELKDGWTQSYPGGGGCHSINLVSSEVEENNNFGNWTTAIITGTKYEDLDANGKRGDGEPGLANWEITLNGTDGMGTVVTLSTETIDGGYYEFSVPPGTYDVCETVETGWSQSYPGGDGCHHNITLTSGGVEQGRDFGNSRIRQVTQTSGLTNTQPSISGDGEWVSFVYDVDGDPEISRVYVPSRDFEFVTNTPFTVTNEVPSTNGDGTVIAFVSDGKWAENADGNQEILAAQMSGTPSFVSVTDTPGSVFPGFNLDPSTDDAGLHIAFASDYDLQAGANADGNLEIFIGIPGGDFPPGIQVTDSALCTNAQPSLSGNSQYVSFVSDCDLLLDGSNADGNPEIFVARLDGSGAIVQVTDSGVGVTNAHPSISTVGERIAYISDADGNSGLFVAELDLSSSMQVKTVEQVTSQAQVTNAHPSLSGSGQYVAFVSSGDLDPNHINSNGNPEIYVAELSLESLDSITVTQIISSGAEVTNAQPSISALGGRVAFISDGDLDPNTDNSDGNPEIFVATFRTGSDVAVQKTASADLVTAGEPLIYTITVRNNLGPAVSTVVLTDTLTTAVDVVKGAPVLPAGVSCEPWTGDSIRCVIGWIAPADTVIFTLSITPSQAGVIANTVLVSTEGDPFPYNNEDTVVLWPYRLYLPLILKNK